MSLTHGWRLPEIYATLPGVISREDDIDTKRQASIDKIKEEYTGVTTYTDGSESEGTRGEDLNYQGDPENSETIHTIQRKGSEFTYEEEVDAMKRTANWISSNFNPKDSQSLCQALFDLGPPNY